jgi:hypothetical protein
MRAVRKARTRLVMMSRQFCRPKGERVATLLAQLNETLTDANAPGVD